MNPSKLILVAAGVLFASGVQALSPDAEQGKVAVATCKSCHDETLDPPKGPPLWSLQRRYKRAYADKTEFVERMADFVAAPTLEKAIHDEGVEKMGLMPAMPLPESNLKAIAAYIYEAEIPPPCTHWKIGVKIAKSKGDMEHAKKDQKQINRFCK